MGVTPTLQELSLPELLEACHRRTADAQRRLYHKYYPFARNVALSYADHESGADDIVQDSFIKLFRYLEADAFTGNFDKFFRRIIVNTGIDHYRARKRRSLLADNLRRVKVGNSVNAAEVELEEQDVFRFLQQLPPRYRLVFNLFVLEGLSHPEIAKRMRISEGTSKSNLSKARKRLRSLVGPYFKL
jgi:RNA polymerase sigma-70 factor (ECF subfamily)